MRKFSRAVVGVVAVLVAASVVAGVGVDEAAAADHVGVEQAGATLGVTVDHSAFGVDDPANGTMTVEIAETEVASGEGPVSTGDGTNRYEIDLTADALAGQDLSSANVTVLPEGGNESTVPGLNLRYVELGDWAAEYAGNELALPVTTSVGIPDGTDVKLAGSAGGESGTLTATMRSRWNNTTLVVSRGDAFATLALADRNLSVSSTGTVELDGGTYDVREPASKAESASLDGDDLVVDHPLLFEEREYTLTITTTQDGTDVLTTRSGTAGDGSMTVEHDGTAQVGTDVTIEHGDVALGTATVSLGAGPDATLSADGQNVTVDSRFGGKGETNVTVFAGESYEQRAQLSGVPYRNNTVLFGEAGHELANASYVLLFEPDSGESFASSIDGDGDAVVNSVGGASSLGMLPSFDLGTAFGIPILAIVGGAALLFVLAVVVVWLLVRDSDDGGRGVSGTTMMDVNVRILDGMTGKLVDQPTRVEFEPTRSHSSNGAVTRTVTGEETVQVPQTTHRVSPVYDGIQQTDSVSPADQQLKLTIPPKSEQITVEAAGTDIGIPDATVALAFPDGNTQERTTGDDGSATFEVPFTVDDRDCELTVDHDRYRSTTTGLTDAVALKPLTGGARVDARLDGEPAPDVDVVVESDDEYTRRVADPKTETTSDDGTVSVEGLPVGAYVAHLNFENSDTVETTPASFEVTADERATATIDAAFSFQLDDDQRSRVDDLHRDISELTPSNRDGAIPYYFGNVLTTVLSTVDEFENSGVVFVSHGVDPDDATEATIAAVSDAVDYTRTAMTNKQNVDLFSACRGLREARVKWDGDVSVTTLVAFLGDGKANHRQEMISRLESVDAVLDEKQDAVSTVTPARDQYEQVREHATGLQDRSPAEQRAHFFVGLQLLDAIESMFDQPELVDRLEETVF